MLSTASYEARKYGVRSAMPGFIAKQLCPDLIFVTPHFEKYTEASRLAKQVMALFDPNVRDSAPRSSAELMADLPQYESYSLDEAALDLTGYLKKHPERVIEDVAEEIQRRIFESVCPASAPPRLTLFLPSRIVLPSSRVALVLVPISAWLRCARM